MNDDQKVVDPMATPTGGVPGATPPAVNPTVDQVPVGTGVPGTMPPAPVATPDPTATPVVETPGVPAIETPEDKPAV